MSREGGQGRVKGGGEGEQGGWIRRGEYEHRA